MVALEGENMALVDVRGGGLLAAMWRPLRLDTLVTLRWLAIGGQTMGVLLVQYGLQYPVPLPQCFALIAISGIFNLVTIFRFGMAHRPSTRFATAQLGFDCVELGGLLALTGGLHNPFAFLLLAPVSVAATILPQRATSVLACLVVIIATLISLYHWPLPWDPDVDLVFDRMYEIGIWASLFCAVVFIAA